MLQIDTSDRSEQRKFGIVVGIAFSIFAVIRWWLHSFEEVPYILFGISAFLVFFGVVYPPFLKPFFIGWIKLALVLNWIMTRVFLTLAYVFMFTPVRVIIHFFGDDPLKRQYLPDQESYWEPPEMQPKDLEAFKKMF